MSQYAHSSWKIRDGFSKGRIGTVAQTPDGYLWLGTEFGLLRFDGVRAVAGLPEGESLPGGSYVRSLLAARDGTLWIGTLAGLASWKDGKLVSYPQLAAHTVNSMVEDREGTVWLGAMGAFVPTPGRICTIRGGSLQCQGEDGSLGRGVFSLYVDSKDRLWAAAETGVWRWKPGPPEFFSLPFRITTLQVLSEDDHGALLVATTGGIMRVLDDGRVEAITLPPGAPVPRQLFRDHHGGLWIGTNEAGLAHLHQGRLDAFTRTDGISGESVGRIFEDREGNVWTATSGGLDRFRESAAVTLAQAQGLTNAGVASVVGSRDGSVWIGTRFGVNRWSEGQVTVYRAGREGSVPAASMRAAPSRTREVAGSGLPDRDITSAYQDKRGRIWIATNAAFGYMENERRFVRVDGVPGGSVDSIAEDGQGNLWIAHRESGLLRLSGSRDVDRVPWSALDVRRDRPAIRLAADPVRGGVWLGYSSGGVAHFADGRVRASYGAADGLGDGRVGLLRVDPDGTLWVATQGGLSRLKNGRFATLTSKNGLPCDGVDWMIEDDADSYWLYMACGFVRIARAELDAWFAAVEHGKDAKRTIRTTVFDISDGVRAVYAVGTYSPHVTKAADGRLWFVNIDGVGIIDPRRLPFNKLAPAVHVEQVIADRKPYAATRDAAGRLRLPPLVRDLQIEYTAPTFVAPEKVRFRYRLDGWDRDWRDAGNRRQALYSDLNPGDYRFRVIAANESGVWNEEGASLAFTIAPAFYQTTWFRAAVAIAVLALLWAIYMLRVTHLEKQFEMRTRERVGERMRIARDLHDTLLQNFHGALLKFHAATSLLPAQPEEAKRKLEGVIESTEKTMAEGRDTVQGLRASTVMTNDLAEDLTRLGSELGAEPAHDPAPAFLVAVEGATRDLIPLVRDEVHRIAREALRNAFRHSRARHIEVRIDYERRQFRLRVRDDGAGIAPEVLAEGGRAGHYGLRGMKERAQLANGTLTLKSVIGRGTEVELAIPANRAYLRA